MNEVAGFEVAVSEWATQYYRRPITINEVTAHGSDWAGDSENGFYSSFEVSLYGKDDTGARFFEDVNGDAMESLWKFVVAGFRQAPSE